MSVGAAGRQRAGSRLTLLFEGLYGTHVSYKVWAAYAPSFVHGILDNLKLWRASRSKAYCFPPWTPSLHTLTRFAQRHSGAKRVVMSSSTATSKAPRCLAGYHPSGVVYGLKLVWLSLYFLSGEIMLGSHCNVRGVQVMRENNPYAFVILLGVTAGPLALSWRGRRPCRIAPCHLRTGTTVDETFANDMTRRVDVIAVDGTSFQHEDMFVGLWDVVIGCSVVIYRTFQLNYLDLLLCRCDGTLGLRLDSVPRPTQDAGLIYPVEINEDSDNDFNNHLEGRLEGTDYLDLTPFDTTCASSSSTSCALIVQVLLMSEVNLASFRPLVASRLAYFRLTVRRLHQLNRGIKTGYDDELVSSHSLCHRLARLPEGSSGLRRWLALLATPFWCGVLTRESDISNATVKPSSSRFRMEYWFDLHCTIYAELTTVFISIRRDKLLQTRPSRGIKTGGSNEADLGFHSWCLLLASIDRLVLQISEETTALGEFIEADVFPHLPIKYAPVEFGCTRGERMSKKGRDMSHVQRQARQSEW
ncbi:hypothetical protein BDZ89DRAFT_1046047 [Hymenopellis radicata]|nr:hypothetical protein BDZ89DRAFT_1046047 [Hymenopellis radicata]